MFRHRMRRRQRKSTSMKPHYLYLIRYRTHAGLMTYATNDAALYEQELSRLHREGIEVVSHYRTRM